MEGLFRPGQVETPFPLEPVIRSITRIETPIYFQQALEYDDADYTLRISRGQVTEWPNSYNFVVDADGVSGNSGGPVFSSTGRLFGIVGDVYPKSVGTSRFVEFSGGLVCVSAHRALEWLGLRF